MELVEVRNKALKIHKILSLVQQSSSALTKYDFLQMFSTLPTLERVNGLFLLILFQVIPQ